MVTVEIDYYLFTVLSLLLVSWQKIVGISDSVLRPGCAGILAFKGWLIFSSCNLFVAEELLLA